MKRLATFWLAMLVLVASCSYINKSPPVETIRINQVPQTIPANAQLIGKDATAVPFYVYVTPEAKAHIDAGRQDIDYFLLTASYDKDGKLLNESHGPISGENIVQIFNYCVRHAFRADALPEEAAWLLYLDVYYKQDKA